MDSPADGRPAPARLVGIQPLIDRVSGQVAPEGDMLRRILVAAHGARGYQAFMAGLNGLRGALGTTSIALIAAATPASAAGPSASSGPSSAPANRGSMNSMPLAIVGFSMAGLGATATVVGGVVWATAPRGTDVCAAAPCPTQEGVSGTHLTAGMSLMISGGVLVLVGVPLGIVGVLPGDDSDAAATQWWTPRVSLGPGSSSLTWSF